MKKMFNPTHKDMQMKTVTHHFLFSHWQSFESIIIPVLAMVWGKQEPSYTVGGNIYYSIFLQINFFNTFYILQKKSNTNLNVYIL